MPELAFLAAKHDIHLVLIALPSASGVEMTRVLAVLPGSRASASAPCLRWRRSSKVLASPHKSATWPSKTFSAAPPYAWKRTRSAPRSKAKSSSSPARPAPSAPNSAARSHASTPPGSWDSKSRESPLFEIDREMRQAFPQTPFYPEIGSIQNRTRLDEVLRQYSPSVVYHAAAYKHVPMMEAHVFEAIENNVFGTYNVAVAAAEHGVEDFVMISSDKAVRPTNVMGATKRVAELLLLALQNGRTKYVAVRFGNVLGSNGSVIPIFKKQIAAGGPVTVTHPEMRRFFMTIPEACQLVLQAAVIGKGGQICVLDMGEPVKIVDLARNLILLSGLRPDEDIKIEFTGMRPGEKLYEELSTMLEDTAPTAHEKIRIFIGNGVPEGDMLTWLDCLREICAARDVAQLILRFKEIVPEYNPSSHVLRRAMADVGLRGEKRMAAAAAV